MTTIALEGDLDPLAARTLRHRLERVTGGERPAVRVDLTAVDRLHPAGVNAIVQAVVRARSRAGSLTVTAPATGPVRRMLTITGLDGIVEQ